MIMLGVGIHSCKKHKWPTLGWLTAVALRLLATALRTFFVSAIAIFVTLLDCGARTTLGGEGCRAGAGRGALHTAAAAVFLLVAVALRILLALAEGTALHPEKFYSHTHIGTLGVFGYRLPS